MARPLKTCSKYNIPLAYIAFLLVVMCVLDMKNSDIYNKIHYFTDIDSGGSISDSATMTTGARNLNRSRVISSFNVKYIIAPRDAYQKRAYLGCVVHSMAEHFYFRMRIRQTWGGQLDSGIPHCDTLLFVLGIPQSRTALVSVQKEAAIYQDIVMGNFTDAYTNLTLKARTAFRYIAEHWTRVKFILKSDDDMLINTRNVLPYLKYLDSRKMSISCFVWANSSPFRDKSHKFFVPKETYGDSKYPSFCSGSAYIMSEGVAPMIDEHVNYVISLPVDDVTITGLARMSHGNIELISIRDKYILNANAEKQALDSNPQNFNHLYFIHRIETDLYYKLWHSLVNLSA